MHKIIFSLGNFIRRPLILKYYKEFMRNNVRSVAELEKQQNDALKQLIAFCFDHIPYYQQLFKKLHITRKDINTIADLDILPILTKVEIKSNTENFSPIKGYANFINASTGGSTGVPLRYRLSDDCRSKGIALLYRGWGAGGYRPGDKVAIIAGASLVANKETFKKKIQNFILNMERYSSYGVDSDKLNKYVSHMNQWKPSYLRGYASSLFILAKHIEENEIDLLFNVKAIFSTAEVLSIHQRMVIERVFHSKIFDTYGLNDGGVSAFECHHHNGMHIDYERSIMQTVDDDGHVVTGVEGRIIATSLYNYAMPFIRYDTGDLGLIDISSPCPCGSKRPLLKHVYGRTTDYLKLNNKIIGSPVLTVLMGKIDIESYQIKQINSNTIDIKYIKNSLIDSKDEDLIKKSFFEHVGPIRINFVKVMPGKLLVKNKYKFIINDVCL